MRSEREAKIRRDYVDWYVISKRTIYLSITALVLLIIGSIVGYLIYTRPPPPPEPKRNEGTRLVGVNGNVTIRRATGEVVPAITGMLLEQGDTVQTASESTASLQYIDGSTLRIKAESTVIVKENAEDTKNKSTTVNNQIVYGTVNMTTTEKGPSGSNIMSTPDVAIDFSRGGQAAGVTYQNNKTDIVVQSGTIPVTTSQGTQETLATNTDTEFSKGLKVSQVNLLPRPKLKSPDNAALLTLDAGEHPGVTFSWSPVPDAVNYNLQIAKSNSFLKSAILFEKSVNTPIYTWALKTVGGSYFWRVQAVARDGKEGIWSEESRLQVVVRQSSSTTLDTFIRIEPPQVTSIATGLVEVSGTTEPGVQLRINDKLILVDSQGKYLAAVDLPGGRGNILITAKDAMGRKGERNVHYP